MGLNDTDPTAYNKDSTARPDHKAPGPQLSCRSLFQTQVEFVNLSAIFRRAIREYANLPVRWCRFMDTTVGDMVEREPVVFLSLPLLHGDFRLFCI